MDFLFLGTSSGTPTKQRNVTGLALIAANGKSWYLIDCGEATQHQLLHTPLSLQRLRGVFITHVHGDHCYGLPGLLASMAMTGRKTHLTIVAPKAIETWIRTTQSITEIYLPFELQFLATETLTAWYDRDMMVDAVVLSHRVPSYAYRFTQTQQIANLNITKLIDDKVPQGPIWGRLHAGQDVSLEDRILLSRDYLNDSSDRRRAIICGDNDRPELLQAALQDTQLLVHEATFIQEIVAKTGKQFQHSSAEMIARFAESVHVPNLILTHFSPRYQYDLTKSPSIADIRSEAQAFYKGNLFLAEDLTRFRLSKSGVLSPVN